MSSQVKFSVKSITHYLNRLFLLSAKFMDEGDPSFNPVTTDESAMKGCLENLCRKNTTISCNCLSNSLHLKHFNNSSNNGRLNVDC